MKIQIEDEKGNRIEPIVLEVGEGELLLVKVKGQLEGVSMNDIAGSIQAAIEHQQVLISPDWIEYTVIKDKK